MMFPFTPPVGTGGSSSGGAPAAWAGDPNTRVHLAPTPRSTVMADGPARLYRFSGAAAPKARTLPLLVVPSLINRWYILDLRAGASFIESIVGAGIDTFCLDWGIPEDEDRYLSWDDVLARLRRAVRKVMRITGAPKVGLLGYCMGGTLSAIHTALEPDTVAALVNLAGPIDFSESGPLGVLVDPRWFDPDAIADAGNVNPLQMQTGFSTLRPTLTLGKIVGMMDRAHDPEARAAFAALETWSSDNVPFPGEAYRTYIRELYQQNALIRGEHRVRGQAVSLTNIRCPVLAIVANRDTICPPVAATALTQASGSSDTEVIAAPGGHVGAVVGRRASRELYPAATAWLGERLKAGPRPA
jgi:polyhydroxyalkanoate synthase subunit PhaC